MSDDWQPGDLALCVSEGVFSRAGAVYTVIDFVAGGGVKCHRCGERNWLTDTLLLVGITPEGSCSGGTASRFRKIKPLTDEEREHELADLPVPALARTKGTPA